MKRSISEEYLVRAKIEELRVEWEAKGYHVENGSTLGGIDADLILRRNGETVVFEVTTGASLAKAAATSPKLAKQVLRLPNTSFHLVVTNPPRERSIEVGGLDHLLYGYLVENTPAELKRLSSRTLVGNVEGVDLTAVTISPGKVKATGSAAVTVRLIHRASDDRQGDADAGSQATLPFEFDVTLDSNLALVAVDRLDVDTSEFDE